MKKNSTKVSNSIDPHTGLYGKSSPSIETAENMTIPRKSTSAERLHSAASSSSLNVQDENGVDDRQASYSLANLTNGGKQVSMTDMDRQYLNMLDNREGFGICPSHDSPTKSIVKKTSMELVNRNLSPTRQAMHKQIGGRIIQENEVKLAQTLDENQGLQKQLVKKNQERDRVQYKYAKTQSNFIEIMRELTRFRKEFNECHSLRSKLILTKTICKDVNGLIKLNQEIIDDDQKYLTGFQNKKNNLFFRR